MIRPRIRETILALDRAARSAGLGFAGLDRILLVGGSSRIPLVAEMVREATERPIALDAHPKHTMALGAAWVAERSRTGGGRRAGRSPSARGGASRGGRERMPGHRRRRRDRSPVPATSRSRPVVRWRHPRRGPTAPSPGRRREPRRLAVRRGARCWSSLVAAGAFAFLPRGGDPGRIARAPSVPGIGAAASASGLASAVAGLGQPGPVGRVGHADRRARRRPRLPPRRPTPSGRAGADHRDHDQRRPLRRRLPGLRVHAEAPGQARPLLLRHRPADAGRHAGHAARGTSTAVRSRSRATRSPTARPRRPRCASSFANPDHSVVQDTGNCVDLPS